MNDKAAEALRRYREEGIEKTPEEYEEAYKNSFRRAVDAFSFECNGCSQEACPAACCSLHKFCAYGKKSGMTPDLWWTQPKSTWRYFVRGDVGKNIGKIKKLGLLYVGPFRALQRIAGSLFDSGG